QNTSSDGLLVNIQTTSAFDQDIHNIHLSTAIEIEDWCNNQKRITLPRVLPKRSDIPWCTVIVVVRLTDGFVTP
ncbi:hypothetical protein, partial [Paenibacillus mendelii]|uniref:hypothetical protein n=1 Tax=Paenibacillus mendelii TaxID=206163 RepID=UPI00211537A0